MAARVDLRDAEPRESVVAYVPDSTYGKRIEDLMEIGRSFGETSDAVRRALGEPVEVVARDTMNIHTGDTDTYLTLRYKGLAFAVYKVAATGDEFLSRATLTADVLGERLPLSIGARQEDIEAYLGEPFHAAAHGENLFLMQYETIGEGATDNLAFWIRGDHLVQIDWVFYVD